VLDSSRSGWEYENEAAPFPQDLDDDDAAAGSEEASLSRDERRAARPRSS
jgi:hypothetical protein